MKTKLFEGKTALVTGASTGIGRATAIAFANESARVIALDINDSDFRSCEAEIQKSGGKVEYFHCDMGNMEEIEAVFSKIKSEYKTLDFAFNNAGIEGEQAFTGDSNLENWDKVIDVNLRSVWACMRREIPMMLENGGGSIINCSSIAGLVGFPGISAYVASKHGIVGLTKCTALEYAKEKIRVNAICPGAIKTPMIDRFTGGNPEATAAMESMAPMGRMGEPEEIASAVLWLCNPGSAFTSGQAIAIDGALVAQ